MPVQVPIDNPNADTEWNDILRKHGIIPEKAPDPEPIIQQALLDAAQKAHENRLEDKDLDELDALEDEEDEDFLASYRAKRMAEINALATASKYGQVYPLQKVDYEREVTEASKEAFVFVHLTGEGGNVESRVLGERFREAAEKFGEVKFCSIRANMCIEGYPDKNCPTILVYGDGDIKRQIVTLRELGGPRTSLADLEGVLVQVGAIKEGDARLRKKDDEEDGERDTRNGRLRQGERRHDPDDGDDDWD